MESQEVPCSTVTRWLALETGGHLGLYVSLATTPVHPHLAPLQAAHLPSHSNTQALAELIVLVTHWRRGKQKWAGNVSVLQTHLGPFPPPRS